MAGPALLPPPLYRFPPTLPSSYSSFTSYTRIYHIHTLPTGPACHCGRSRVTFRTFPPPLASYSDTTPCSLRGPACHCGRSRPPILSPPLILALYAIPARLVIVAGPANSSYCLSTPVNSFPSPPFLWSLGSRLLPIVPPSERPG